MRRAGYNIVGTTTGRVNLTGTNIQSFQSFPRSEPKSKYLITEERILQISNDISKDMCSASKRELTEVVKYFRNQFDELWWRHLHFGQSIGTSLMTAGIEILREASSKIAKTKAKEG